MRGPGFSFLAHQFFDGGLERFRPGGVAVLVGVGAVGDEVSSETAAGEEGVVHVEVVDHLAVVEGGDQLVDLHVFLAGGVVVVAAAGEDRQDEDLGGGEFRSQQVHDEADVLGGVAWRAAHVVVGADHEDGELG